MCYASDVEFHGFKVASDSLPLQTICEGYAL